MKRGQGKSSGGLNVQYVNVLFSYFYFLKNFIYSFIFGYAGSLLHRLSLVVESRGCFLVVVCGLLIVVVSLVAEQGL